MKRIVKPSYEQFGGIQELIATKQARLLAEQQAAEHHPTVASAIDVRAKLFEVTERTARQAAALAIANGEAFDTRLYMEHTLKRRTIIGNIKLVSRFESTLQSGWTLVRGDSESTVGGGVNYSGSWGGILIKRSQGIILASDGTMSTYVGFYDDNDKSRVSLGNSITCTGFGGKRLTHPSTPFLNKLTPEDLPLYPPPSDTFTLNNLEHGLAAFVIKITK